MHLLHCETREGLTPAQAVADVQDVYGKHHFMLVDRDFLVFRDGEAYLPVGVVFQDKEKGMALIEFAEEADSGVLRVWVFLANLIKSEAPEKGYEGVFATQAPELPTSLPSPTGRAPRKRRR